MLTGAWGLEFVRLSEIPSFALDIGSISSSIKIGEIYDHPVSTDLEGESQYSISITL